ncbi:MAG: AmmeMemoRadiSam system protein A [candidate division WOR-3 bacterium]
MARETIVRCSRGERLPVFRPNSSRLNEPYGVFVTLKKSDELRGCIGYVEAIKPLSQAIPLMAHAAAFEDPRFPPVQSDEVADLDIEVTILSPLRKISSIEEIEIGRHGLMVKQGLRQGLLLPQVAVEEDWDRETFLRHTCLKAGLSPDDYRKQSVDIYIFEGLIIREKDRKKI